MTNHELLWRPVCVGERIRGDHVRGKVLVIVQELGSQAQHPRILFILLKCGEPHEPIESVMIRRDETRSAIHTAWFTLELVLVPGDLLVRIVDLSAQSALEDDFVAHFGHTPERAVCVHESKRLKRCVHDLLG